VSVEFGSADTLPVSVAVYECAICGRTTAQHGLAAGEAPPGWVEPDTPEDDYVCAACGERSSTIR
jgi:DNA-directed RNA polymerase subunit RPC12/RpoP